ncbi:MAG: tetratricopeptide repeat protein, partial [Chloroflexi bacterium]|nr:tetratricopeptide repeat protein [Chloroflexota bacterium]
MTEISLRAYQDELDYLLRDQNSDEVIAHARHILKSQPKNLRAYQQLGDALVASGRWDEATDVLGRALGAQPQDYNTHSQLARAFQHLGNYDRAIWHAERALDQMPGDQESIALIRELYRAHRNEEIDRLQLTTAALAQQHIRGNLLTEALSTLATALERSPNRVDLQLLRARALWLDGRRMDAAETALDILERLPYVIEANRIMTELWLAEQRPSDAQLYLKRIEDLDPYLASQMATGEEAAENLLMMDRLDYSASAQREREIVNPEWLDNLGETDSDDAETAEESGGLGALLGIDGSEQAPDDKDVTADLDDLLSDEQIEQLFSELVIGEPVAEVSEALPAEDEAAAILNTMEEQGFIDETASAADADEKPQLFDESNDLVKFAAQAGAPEAAAETTQADDIRVELDGDLADLLEQLDSADENGDWMADIQGESLALEGDDESQEYLDDFEREWVKAGQEEEGGAPWLSAAMREAMDRPDGDLDVFADDDQLQKLLSLDSDTEPLHLSDIEDWLAAEPDDAGAEADERFLDIEDEMLHSPPGASGSGVVEAPKGS